MGCSPSSPTTPRFHPAPSRKRLDLLHHSGEIENRGKVEDSAYAVDKEFGGDGCRGDGDEVFGVFGAEVEEGTACSVVGV